MDESTPPATRSRRGFLTRAAGVVIGAGVLGQATVASAAAESAPRSSTTVHPAPHAPLPAHPHHNRRRFEDAPGGRVTVELPEGSVALTIDSIEALDVAAEAKAGSPLWRDAFRVNLSGPKGTDLPQGTHRARIGGRAFNLFVVPILSTGGQRHFEAIIHRAYHRSAHG